MFNNKSMQLSELVKNLGYENHKSMSNWVQNIIRNKENFKKYIFKPDKPNGRQDAKSEIFYIREDAKILVDNLCFSKPYIQAFFKKAQENSNELPIYQVLKNGVDKNTFDIQVQKLQNKLISKRKINEKAINQIPQFISAIKKKESIDITKERLKDLINTTSDQFNIINTSNAYKIAAWNELTELEDQMSNEGESSNLHISIAEKLIELGDISEAIEALNNATDLDQTDGIAWALKAKVYLEILTQTLKDQKEVLKQNEYRGFIENPIIPEEYWINEAIEDTMTRSEDIHNLFIHTCLSAFKYWSCWDNHKDNLNKIYNDYKLSISSSYSKSIIIRKWLFFHFVMKLRKTDIVPAREVEFIQILKSFQQQNSHIPNLSDLGTNSIEANYEAQFQTKIIKILSWFDPKETKLALKSIVSKYKEQKISAEEGLLVLMHSDISKLIWEHLGNKKFLQFKLLLEKYADVNNKKQCLIAICNLQLNSVISNFDETIKALRDKELPFGPKVDLESYKILNKQEIWNDNNISQHMQSQIKLALKSIEGWRNFLNAPFCQKTLSDKDQPQELLALILISTLIEIANKIEISKNMKIISDYSKDKDVLKKALIPLVFLNYNFIIYFFKTSNFQILEEDLLNKLEKLFETSQILNFNINEGN